MRSSKLVSYVASIALAPFFLVGSTYGADGQANDSNTRVDIQSMFTPSGWMGDGEYGRKYIEFFAADKTRPHARSQSIRISYTFGPKNFGGIYWQNLPDNWGDKPGSDYSTKGLSRVSFWARGASGDETIEFKAGGIDNPKKKFRDSFEVTLGRIALTTEWKKYTIELGKADLRSVIGGFCWVGSGDYNGGKKITFYLEEIVME